MKKKIILLGILASILMVALVVFWLARPKDKIDEFLHTNPLKITFKDADKYLSKNFTASESDTYNSLNSKKSEFGKGNMTFYNAISQDKNDGSIYYSMYFENVASCEYFADIIKDSYKKDFVYNIDGEGDFKFMIGSIDVKDWRVSVFCLKEKGSIDLVVLRSGAKDKIKKVARRQKIECEYKQNNGGTVVYQIDEEEKVLLGSNGYSMGEVKRFDDEFIIVKRDKDLEIKIDRKSAKFEARSIKSPSMLIISGICKKRASEKKF